MKTIDPLQLFLLRNKQAVVAAPGGQPQMMNQQQGGMPPGMPMDPSMMGGGMPPGMPMDPSMMGGGMPMDPSMMGGGMPPGMPMDPSMMGGGMPSAPAPAPSEPPKEDTKSRKVNIEQELAEMKEMMQALVESQIAIMQTLTGGGMPPGMPMDPSMMGGGMPPQQMDPSMMGGGMPPQQMDPSMMGGGMQVTASHKNAQDKELANYLKSISDLLR
jgi:hypothetical protein